MAGIACPRCGCRDLRDASQWKTANTVPIPGAVRRYKICRYCGKRVRTKETIEQSKE